jgi:HK97 family phage major capsid protein
VEELKKLIEEQGKAWDAFQQAHKQQLDELKKGKADAVLADKVEALNKALSDLDAKRDAIETSIKLETENREALERKYNELKLAGTSKVSESEHKTLGDFNLQRKANAVMQGHAPPQDVGIEEFRAYKAAYRTYAAKGERFMSAAEEKALIVGADPSGGYWVPPDTGGRIITRVFDLSPIRQIASVQTISSDRLEGVADIDESSSGWVGETQARTDTTTPVIGKYDIPVREIYAQPKASQKLLDDAAVDIEMWLAAKVSDRFARQEGNAFVAGDGVLRPHGFTQYPTAATSDATRAWGTFEHIATGVSGDFAGTTPADILFDIEAAFRPGYLANAKWVTRRSVIQKLRKFKATTNEYLWQPSLQGGRPNLLIGYPIVMAEDMPALGANSLSLALGDFNAGYQIVDRIGIRTLRDPYTSKPYVVFYTTMRVGGGALNFEAIKFIKFI